VNRSLQRHLSLMLGSAVLLAALLAAAISFGLAYLEAKEFQDDMLKQVASITAGHTGRTAVDAQGAGRADQAAGDVESRLSVLHLPEDARPDWLAASIAPGFHTLPSKTGDVRVFIAQRNPGNRTVVAQPTDVRNEIAINSALRTLVPLLLLLPVLAWLIVRIVRRELAPVVRLSQSLDEQPGDRPHSLPDRDVPAEIAPFVQAINRLLDRVGSLMAQQRRFIADAAHELRSPLTAISVQVQNVRNAGSLAAMRERLNPLEDGIERARRLTEQLLNLAKTQTDASHASPVDVLALARELIAEFVPIAEQKGIDLGFADVVPLRISAAPEVLRQVLRNAIENALNYTPAGGQVSVRVSSDGADDVIEVIDDGPGIPPPERERVFDSFYRMPGSNGQGSGIGLAIARESALRMGGRVSLHGRADGAGLVFRYRQARNGSAT
jgi:two-component system OmpR family sensor kinase